MIEARQWNYCRPAGMLDQCYGNGTCPAEPQISIENKHPRNLGQPYAGECRLSKVFVGSVHRYHVMRRHCKVSLEVTRFSPRSFAAAAAFAGASFAREAGRRYLCLKARWRNGSAVLKRGFFLPHACSWCSASQTWLQGDAGMALVLMCFGLSRCDWICGLQVYSCSQ